MNTIKPLPAVKEYDHPSNNIGINWGIIEMQWIKERDAKWMAYIEKLLTENPKTTENTDWENACARVLELNTKSGHVPGYAVTSGSMDLRHFYTGDWINAAYMTQERVTIEGKEYMVAHAVNPVKGCFVPMGTHIGHLRDCNGAVPYLDYSKKWGGVFKGAPVSTDSWRCFEEGAMLFTSDGKEELEPGTHYRVLEKTDGKAGVMLLVRKSRFPYPDRDTFVSLNEF